MSASPARAHRQGITRSPAPRGPRRISGPTRTPAAREAARVARGSRSMTAAGGAVALPRPAGVPSSFLPRAADALRRLPDSRWLDRLMRGQTWIVLIGIALMGIVAMQVSLLKMNAGIGRAVEHSSTLERQNADLRAAVSTLSSEERIQREAATMGFVMPPAGDVRYVKARGAEDARRAAKTMRPPSAPQPVDALAQAQTGAPAAAAATATTTPPEQQAVPPVEPQVQQQTAAAPQAAAEQQAATPQAAVQPQSAQPQAAATGAAAAPTGAATP